MNLSNNLENVYFPINIKVYALRLLETIYIMEESKVVDVVMGRSENYMELISNLSKWCKHERYVSDIQSGIIEYKRLYYDRSPSDTALFILLKPDSYSHPEFISTALFFSFGRMLEDFISAYQLLVKEAAKQKRKNKILEVLESTRNEITSKYANADSFRKISSTFSMVESVIKNQSDFSNVEIIFKK